MPTPRQALKRILSDGVCQPERLERNELPSLLGVQVYFTVLFAGDSNPEGIESGSDARSGNEGIQGILCLGDP